MPSLFCFDSIALSRCGRLVLLERGELRFQGTLKGGPRLAAGFVASEIGEPCDEIGMTQSA